MDGPPLKKKRKERKQSQIKKKKVLGEEHTNHVGKAIPARKTGPDCKCRWLKCFANVRAELRMFLLNQFNEMDSKNEQDSHLSGLISKSVPKHKSNAIIPENEEENVQQNLKYPNSAVFKYKVRSPDGYEIKVCAKAFISIHGITRGRLRTIQQSLVVHGISPKDKRGKHGNVHNKTPENIKKLIMDHIESFQAQTSHYSYRKNPDRKYLPADLSVSKMHNMFLDLYRINISYFTYYSIFINEYNLHFGLPKSDTCAKCDTLEQRMAACNEDKQRNLIKVEKELHQRQADKFHELKRFYVAKARSGALDLFSFDFMQNLPLPHIPTGDVFYARQLWYNVFGVHNLASNNVYMMTYNETIAKKGQNDVTSLIFKYLQLEGAESNEAILISDGCAGQNKNYVMVKFLYALVHILKIYKKITHIFPVRGHTYLPNDQDFGLIGNKRNKVTAEVEDEWDSVIQSARSKPTPFNLIKMEQHNFFDIAAALSPYFLKQAKPPMRLKQARMIQITNTEELVKVRDSYTGSWRSVRLRNNTRLPTELCLNPGYNSKIPLNTSKLNDVLCLAKFIKPAHQSFYTDLQNIGIGGNDVSEDDDDNSSAAED